MEKYPNRSKPINHEDIIFDDLEGDGDFNSSEITNIQKEADIIITNPPFSLFRDFIEWILSSNKQFAVIANQNVYTYNSIFTLIKNNRIWAGTCSGDMEFKVLNDSPIKTFILFILLILSIFFTINLYIYILFCLLNSKTTKNLQPSKK